MNRMSFDLADLITTWVASGAPMAPPRNGEDARRGPSAPQSDSTAPARRYRFLGRRLAD